VNTTLRGLFHTRHADWHPAAQRHWERLTGDRRAG